MLAFIVLGTMVLIGWWDYKEAKRSSFDGKFKLKMVFEKKEEDRVFYEIPDKL